MGNIISGHRQGAAKNTSGISTGNYIRYPKDTGNYIGYTRGEEDQKPTLYFEKGHYTQQYDHDLDNVGWHPVRSKYHVMVNYNYRAKDDEDSASEDGIDPGNDEEDLIIIRNGGQNRLQIKNDLDKLIKGKEWADKMAAIEAHFLIEYDVINGGIRNLHKSRGKLMVYEEKEEGSDKEFGPEDAAKMMTKAKLADNEKKKNKNEKGSHQDSGSA